MVPYKDNPLPLAVFISLSNVTKLLSIASATFYRTVDNSNVTIFSPVGQSTESVYISPDIYLPVIFNTKNETTIIKYTNNKDVLITNNVTCEHTVSLQFKLNKLDGINFANQREFRFTLVKQDGTSYNAVSASYQPDTGSHITANLNMNIIHATNDIVKIKINIIQDNTLLDVSDTLITIFSISWNIKSFAF